MGGATRAGKNPRRRRRRWRDGDARSAARGEGGGEGGGRARTRCSGVRPLASPRPETAPPVFFSNALAASRTSSAVFSFTAAMNVSTSPMADITLLDAAPSFVDDIADETGSARRARGARNRGARGGGPRAGRTSARARTRTRRTRGGLCGRDDDSASAVEVLPRRRARSSALPVTPLTTTELPRGPISARVASRRTQRAVSRVTHRHARYRPRLVPAPAHSSPADPRCPPPRPRSPVSPRSETRARRLVRCARAGPARPRPRSLPRVLPFCLFCSNRASTRSNVASFV